MKKLFILAVCAALAGFLQAEAFDASGFAKMLEIKSSQTSVATGVVLPDFQALVRLSADIEGFSYSNFQQENGADLAFLDADGNLLAHEIDTWNPQGESLVWVRIPAFRRGMSLYMVYGNTSYTKSFSAADVWSGYTGVWHMKEAEGVVSDATGHGLDATPTGGRAEHNVGIADGVVGMARKNGGNGGNAVEDRVYLSIPNYDSFALGATFTASGFFRINGSGGWYRLFSRRGPGGGWGQEVHCEDAEKVHVYGADGAMPTVNISGLEGGWEHLVFAYCGTICNVYANGALVDTLNISPATENGAPLSIGCTSNGDEWCLFGDYDEVRLGGGNPSAERVAADYSTATRKDFFNYGAAENYSSQKVKPSNFTKMLRITASKTAVPSGAAVSKFPALVRLSERIEGFSYADFPKNGAELVFADESGRVLPCEIDTWNPDGESLVWVKVPLFQNEMVIFAYWGGNESLPLAASETWSDYTGVWHMNKSGAESETDVSGNELHAKPWDSAKTEDMMAIADGAVGVARINQTTDEVRNCLSVPSYPAIGDTFTVSGWFNASAKIGWHRLLSRKTAYGTDGWEVEMYSGADKIDVYGSGEKNVCVEVTDIEGTWNHLAFVYSGTKVAVYQNGLKIADGSINAVEDLADRPLGIGNNAVCGERSFIGSYDEVRLMRGALSSSRIEADYATVINTDFFAYGSVGIPAADSPVMTEPVLFKNEQGEISVSGSMTSGRGELYARFVSGDEKIDVALSDGIVTAPVNFTLTIPELSQNRTYLVCAVGVNAKGGEIVAQCADTFYTGEVSVSKTSDAAEDGLVSGVFTVSRADIHGDLVVNYSFGGSAVAGVDYVGAAQGVVTIPAGASSVAVNVTPKVNAQENADTLVEFSFADGFYGTSDTTASMTIENLEPVTRKAFKRCIDFTFPMEFLGEGEELENFPVLIKLSEEIHGFYYRTFELSGGRDMMFTDSSGNAIPSEISVWDVDGTSLVWVSVPKLAKGTRIKMYYGNGVNPAGVYLAKWPGYAGVWHLEESDGTAFDSSANAFDAIAMRNARSRAVDLVAVADGAIGNARVNQDGTTFYDVGTYNETVFSTARRNYLSVSSSIDRGLNARFSFSGWFRTVGGTEWSETLVCKRVSGYNYGWKVLKKPSLNGGDTKIEVKVADGGDEFVIPNMRDSWVHLFVSMDREETGEADNPYKSVASIYANGVFLGKAAGSTRIHENDYPLTFGHIDSLTTDHAFYGQYDELRLKRGAASAAWAKAEYLTVADSSFVKASSSMPAIGVFKIIVR